MEKLDARKLNQAAQHEIRRQAIKLHLKEFGPSKIAEDLNLHRNAVTVWVSRYKEGGMKALSKEKRGPRLGTTLQLDEAAQKNIRKQLVEKNPDQLKLPFALWTRKDVGLLISEQTGQVLDLRQVGRYLKHWGFTPQRPVKRASQRNEKIEEWLQPQYPAIKKRAESEDGEIHWTDEVGLNSHDNRGRKHAPKGKKQVSFHNPPYEKINMNSSGTNQGKLKFKCYEGSVYQLVFNRFLSALARDAAGRKLYVIVDNHRVHHQKVIHRWLRRYAMFIEVHYLPSYSPHLNPDEYLNCDVKTELAKRQERRTKGKWRESVESALKSIASQPERVVSYFKTIHIQYAA